MCLYLAVYSCYQLVAVNKVAEKSENEYIFTGAEGIYSCLIAQYTFQYIAT